MMCFTPKRLPVTEFENLTLVRASCAIARMRIGVFCIFMNLGNLFGVLFAMTRCSFGYRDVFNSVTFGNLFDVRAGSWFSIGYRPCFVSVTRSERYGIGI